VNKDIKITVRFTHSLNLLKSGNDSRKGTIMIKLAPSILAADFAHLADCVKEAEAAGAHYVHIDVMDGHFVPNITYGAPVMKSLRPHTNLIFDVHLMISDPIKYIDDFVKAGADIITFHVNSESDVDATIEKIKSHGKKCGLAVNPDIDVELLYPYLGKIDMVLIMSVYAGFGGQSYILDVNKKIAAAREFFGPDIDIEVDGGIYLENKDMPISYGANVLVAGSAVFGSDDIGATVKNFLK